MDILGKLRHLMEVRGWSAYYLSKQSGVPQSTISSLFAKNNMPSIPTLESLCKAFNISLSEFFADGPAPGLTEEQRTMLEHWEELTPEQKTLLLELIRQMK